MVLELIFRGSLSPISTHLRGSLSPVSFWWSKFNLSNSKRPHPACSQDIGTPTIWGPKSQVPSVNLILDHCPPPTLASSKPPCSPLPWPLFIVHAECLLRLLIPMVELHWSFGYFQTYLPIEHALTCFSAIPFLLRSTKCPWLNGQGRTENPWLISKIIIPSQGSHTYTQTHTNGG